MAQLVFTEEDGRLIESLMEEFDPAKHLANAQARDRMASPDWQAFLEMVRATTRLYVTAAVITMALDLPPSPQRREIMIWIIEGGASVLPQLKAERESEAWDLVPDYPVTMVQELENVTNDLRDEAVTRILGPHHAEPIN